MALRRAKRAKEKEKMIREAAAELARKEAEAQEKVRKKALEA